MISSLTSLLFAFLSLAIVSCCGHTLYSVTQVGPWASRGYDVNNFGQVVTSSGFRAFFYDNGSTTDLGTLGGGFTEAWAVNSVEQIVGASDTGISPAHAF